MSSLIVLVILVINLFIAYFILLLVFWKYASFVSSQVHLVSFLHVERMVLCSMLISERTRHTSKTLTQQG